MRIVFQDLKVGLKKDSILKRLSSTAVQRFDETRSLRTVCEEICEQQRDHQNQQQQLTELGARSSSALLGPSKSSGVTVSFRFLKT
jgi:hypothetical protein